MKKTILTFTFIALCCSTISALAQEAKFPPVPPAPTVAHRGFSAIAPENTLAAARKAIEIGAQGSEFDVYSTTDGLLYLNHDANLKRTTGYDCAAKAIDSKTLLTLDFGSWKGEEFKGEKVATYDEALQLLKGTKTRPIIEIKENGFEDKIVEGIRKYDLVETAIVIDFSAARVQKIRELEPKVCVAWLCSFDVKKETPQSMAQKIIDTLKKCNTNVVDVQYNAISPEFLKILDEAGIEVMCWTVDNPADIERLVNWGVKSITTNRPDLVLEAQKKAAANNKTTK